ncbi:MAG TPA: hypothetical protein VI138_02940 [Candidatus Dormibacteraeota bacterium]
MSSRDGSGVGSVRMWFAVVPPGYVFLLTPAHTIKAGRWRDDPWVRLRIPGTRASQEGVVIPVSWKEAAADADLLTDRFAMAGATTAEGLRWMLDDGSRLLLRAGLRSGSERVDRVHAADGA